MAHIPETSTALHGVMAEYDNGQALVDAARKTMAHGFTQVEAYSPVPIEDLNTIIHKKRTVLPKLVLTGGLTGMATGFVLQYWASVIEYPMNIGGRPLASWTTFIVERFSMASSDKFFLVIESTDPKFKDATSFLNGLGAKGVYDVAE